MIFAAIEGIKFAENNLYPIARPLIGSALMAMSYIASIKSSERCARPRPPIFDLARKCSPRGDLRGLRFCATTMVATLRFDGPRGMQTESGTTLSGRPFFLVSSASGGLALGAPCRHCLFRNQDSASQPHLA